MKGLNSLVLGGFVTRDPELRMTVKGSQVCSFGLAVNGIVMEDEVRVPDTVYIDVVCWHRQAETCHQYLKKGRLVVVEGRLSMRHWVDKLQGAKFHYEVSAKAVHFMEGVERVEAVTRRAPADAD